MLSLPIKKRPDAFAPGRLRIALHFCEDDDHGEQGQGLDEGQTQNQEEHDARARSRVASQGFNSRTNGLTLP